jgi:nifR3 family TIM-barrel protein
MTNFWNNLRKPFFCLAPMADVTDPAFRRLIAKYGKPDVTWTEFVSADGLCHPVGREKLMLDLAFTEAERPIVAQLFSSNPDHMRIAAKLCADMGYDGVDINMGCPDRTIEKQGCGSAMIKTPERALEIIQAAREGAPNLPISVKTRVGYSKEDIDGWIVLLLKQKLAALTIHARTRKDLSEVPANWDYVSRIVTLRDEISPETVIIGNGDVRDMQDGYEKARESGCDGIMIGRACFGNPWIFNETIQVKKRGSWKRNIFLRMLPNAWAKKIMGDSRYTISDIPLDQKLLTLVEHSKMFCELLPHKNFATMKKHYKAYCTGFPGAKELRIKLMESKDVKEVEQIVDSFISTSL